jgi:alpha-L-fucosidase
MNRALRSACAALLASLCAVASAQNAVDIKPTPQQNAWQDLEFGVILHFGPNTFMDREWGDGHASTSVFNPTDFNPDQWMDAIKASGATYVVFVAKHHDGFCLWPTEQTEYSVKSSPWFAAQPNGKGDVVAAVAKSARAHGLKFGVYLSPWDRHDPRYADPAAYDKYYNDELVELVTHYGDLVEFWLDGAGSEGHVYNFAKIIVFADTALFEYGDARWAGDESGKIEYENWNVIDRHGYLRWRPVEVDTPLHKLHWFWHPNDTASLKSVDELLNLYDNAVGHGGQWMLGVAPDDRGLLPEADATRLRELGAAVRARYANNLVKNHLPTDDNTARALDGDRDTFWSAPAGSRSATLELRLPRPVTFNHALTMEWLAEGQLVQKYSIQAWQNGAWKTLLNDEAIGHKKVDSFPAVTADRVRLNLLSTSGTARIREFQLYSVPDNSVPDPPK